MTHFDEQNGPFCDAKRPILKIRSVLTVKKDGLFAFSEAFGLLKRKKNLTGFFGKIFRQFIRKTYGLFGLIFLLYLYCLRTLWTFGTITPVVLIIVYGLSGLLGLFRWGVSLKSFESQKSVD